MITEFDEESDSFIQICENITVKAQHGPFRSFLFRIKQRNLFLQGVSDFRGKGCSRLFKIYGIIPTEIGECQNAFII